MINFYIGYVDYMLAICAYYASIMLNVIATYNAHNYAGIIGSSLSMTIAISTSYINILLIQLKAMWSRHETYLKVTT